jgi:hypothetical protein
MQRFPDHVLKKLLRNGKLNEPPRNKGAPLDLTPVLKLHTADRLRTWIYSEAIIQPRMSDVFLYGIAKIDRARPEITVSSLLAIQSAHLRGYLFIYDAEWQPTGTLSQYLHAAEIAGEIIDPNQ